jgi:5'-nucleotidase
MQQITRRGFLRRVALAGGAVAYVYANGRYRIALGAGPVVYKLRILHTNDHHARIEPSTVTLRSSPEPVITRSFGGVARRKTLIDHIRATAAPDEHVLLLDAGDVFQGTLYFTRFSGQADLYFYNAMGYDAVAVGNHEFDKGQSPLKDFILGANFPVLSANLAVQSSAALAPALAPSEVAVTGRLGKRLIFARGGKNIGIFGLTTATTSVLSNVGTGVTFGADLAAISQAQVDALRAAGANYVVGLTHIGHSADVKLAEQVRGIDAIVGGHSHTPLLPEGYSAPLGEEADGPYPVIVKDPDGADVIVTSDWRWGLWLGDMTLGFDAGGNVSVISGVIRPVWAGGLDNPPRSPLPGEEAEIAPDASFQTRIDTVYKPLITELQATVVGQSSVVLEGDRANVRNRETNLGNLIADVMLDRIRPDGGQIALMNGGGIGRTIPAGDVTLAEVLDALPHDNTIARVDVTGAQLVQALENAVSQVNLQNPSNSSGRFVQVSGLCFAWTPHGPVGNRILSAQTVSPATLSDGARTSVSLTPIDPGAIYRVVTNDFMLAGGDDYTMLAQGENSIDTGFNLTDVLSEHITANSPVSASVEGRITMAERISLPWIRRG